MWWMGYQSTRNDLQNAIKALWGLILTPFDIYFDIWIFRYLDKYSYLNGFIISYSIFLYFSFGYILEECAKCNKGTMGLNSKPSLPPFDIYLDTIPYHILTQYLTTQNAGVHKSRNVLPSWTDPGSSAHKRVCYYFLYRRDKCRK